MFFYHCSVLIPCVSGHGPMSGNTTRSQNPPSLSHTHFYLGKCASTPTFSCLVLAAMVKLTLSCGRLSQWTIWRRPLYSMIPISQQKKPHPFASDYTPGQRRGWGSYVVEWGGEIFKGEIEGGVRWIAPLLSPPPSCLVGRTPRAGFHIFPLGWCL